MEWYYTEEGELPAYEYFRKMNQRSQDRFLYIVKYLADASRGELLPRTMLNIEDRQEKIYALKPDVERFFTFMFAGGKVIVTNAFRKHSQKMTRKDREKLKTAVRYRRDYIKRIGEGVYYGSESEESV